MDNGASMTFTSLALILLLLIIIVMFACHMLGPRATCGWAWLRSNREEKIGLSKNKLFHANGYMLPSSSAFLLSNSGSFKRFDIIEKEETQSLRTAPATDQSTQAKHSAHATTPFWNLPQTESEIPPQPLRPAPAPAATTTTTSTASAACKTVTFGRVDEITTHDFEGSIRSASIKEEPPSPIALPRYQAEIRVPAPRYSLKFGNLPQPLEAPPPPRLSSLATMNGATAIPRPLVRRQIPLDKFHSECNQTRQHPLTRRNSSTNPFLCDSIDGAGQQELHHDNHTALNIAECKIIHETGDNAFKSCSPASELNPFLENGPPQNLNHYKSLNGTQHMTESQMKNNFKQLNLNPQNHLRQGRSLSDTLWSMDKDGKDTQKTSPSRSPVRGFIKLPNGKTNPFAGLAQRAKGPHMLQKTFSEDFLFRKIGVNPTAAATGSNGNTENGATTWTFGRSLLRQDSILSLGRRNSSQGSLDSNSSVDGLQHAVSCESVDSDSVFLSNLDQPYTQITGQLNVGLEYDNVNNDGMELTVKIIEAKNLIPPFAVESLDTFVRIYLVPDHAGALQTEIVVDSKTPYYDESFNFWLRRQNCRHSLWFHLYHNGESHTLIGEAEMEIYETPRSVTTWMPLSDSRKWNAQWGELMFSLSYLPTAERLTIVVVKARNLKFDIKDAPDAKQHEIQSVFVKVYLMNNEKKILKKRTSFKRRDRSIVFNESMIFSVPPPGLTTVQLRLTVYGLVDSTTIVPLGHVIAGSCATGKGLRHWHQMLSSLRKPVSMWHVLRRATNQPIFTGGAEAVVAAMQSTSLRSKRNSII